MLPRYTCLDIWKCTKFKWLSHYLIRCVQSADFHFMKAYGLYYSYTQYWTHSSKGYLVHGPCFPRYTCLDIRKCTMFKRLSHYLIRCVHRADSHFTVFFKTRGHLSRLAWPTQRDGLSCLASPRLALRCAAWPSKTSPDSCSRPVATSGCSHRYYNDNAKCINIAFFSVSEAMFLYKNECLKWQNISLKK